MSNTGKLIITPTPIGNLGDITLRAVETLRTADAVLCEDTRVTGKLMAHLDMHKPLVRLDENTIRERTDAVIERLQAGETLAYCSDAGMPGVSDPGMHLVACVREAGLPVEVLPGASAATTAYVASGFPQTRFLFAGFMPKREAEKRDALERVCSLDAALIFYESPHRLVSSLQAIANVFPHRRVAVCRELTKLHEEVFTAQTMDAAHEFAARAEAASVKGEIVLVIEGPTDAEGAYVQGDAEEAARRQAAALIERGARPKEVAKQLAAQFDISRNAAYEIALAVRNEGASA